MKSNCHKVYFVILYCIFGAFLSAASISAKVEGTAYLRLPNGALRSGEIWHSSDDIKFSEGLFGRFGLYEDAPAEKILQWFRERQVDRWLRPSSSDVPRIQVVSLEADRVILRWVRDCYSKNPKNYNISFRRWKMREGKTFWFVLLLEDWRGSQERIDVLDRAFDRTWRKGKLKFTQINSRPLFNMYQPHFKITSIPNTLDEAISLVHGQITEDEQLLLRGKSWKEQYQSFANSGLLHAIEEDLGLDGGCNPLSHIRRKADGAMMPESWVSAFILKGVVAKIEGRTFVVEEELNQTGLIPGREIHDHVVPPKH